MRINRLREGLAAFIYEGVSIRKIQPHLVVASEQRFYYCWQDERYQYVYSMADGIETRTVNAYSPIKVDVVRVNSVDLDIFNTQYYYRPGAVKKGDRVKLYETEEEIIRNLIRIV